MRIWPLETESPSSLKNDFGLQKWGKKYKPRVIMARVQYYHGEKKDPPSRENEFKYSKSALSRYNLLARVNRANSSSGIINIEMQRSSSG